MRYLLALWLFVMAGCCGAAPDEVIAAQQHAVEDMVLAATEVPPLITDAAEAKKWDARFRAFALRALTLLAYLKDEPIDVAAAHAKLFAKDGE